MKDIFSFFDNEDDYADIDVASAANTLSEAIRCKTVNFADHLLTDYSQFELLHRLIRKSYPSLAKAARFEVIGKSALLITINGSDKSLLPCLFMAHQDVVPASGEGWSYPPFEGAIADGYIWGRGALDVKDQLFGSLEACEYLIAHGYRFKRSVYLSFGDDEETLRSGAKALAETLHSRGVRLEFLLDECAGKIESAEAFGACGAYFSPIGVMEKGYADIELSVSGGGGHSARPFGGTSLGKLARAIASIVENPIEPKLSPLMKDFFLTLKPYINKEPLKTLVADIDKNGALIARYCYNDPVLFPYVTTTFAPTVIEGGSAMNNILPQNMRAVINTRIAPTETLEDVRAHVEGLIDGTSVAVRFIKADPPSARADTACRGYDMLKSAMARYYKGALFIPSLVTGASDARNYETVCNACFRCSPFMAPHQDVAGGVHGVNERISIRAYAQGIRVLTELIKIACCEG